jgi:hypothetical protein
MKFVLQPQATHRVRHIIPSHSAPAGISYPYTSLSLSNSSCASPTVEAQLHKSLGSAACQRTEQGNAGTGTEKKTGGGEGATDCHPRLDPHSGLVPLLGQQRSCGSEPSAGPSPRPGCGAHLRSARRRSLPLDCQHDTTALRTPREGTTSAFNNSIRGLSTRKAHLTHSPLS